MNQEKIETKVENQLKENRENAVKDVLMQTGFLTTHVLDMARGSPAGGLHITLFRLHDHDCKAISTAVTNDDGRTDSPILPTDDFQTGQYRLVFHAGPYLNMHFSDLPEPKFLSDIPIDFAIADAESHYHVPLLLSPFGYSTYRGS